MQVIVVGSGIIGSAIAWEMEQAGHDVLRIDDDQAQGSAGKGRIFRISHESPLLQEDARESLYLWHEWERKMGEELLLGNTLWLRGGWAREDISGRFPYCASERRYAQDSRAGVGLIHKTMDALQRDLSGERIYSSVARTENGKVLLESGEILHADFVFVAAGIHTRRIMGIPSESPWHHLRFSFPAKESIEETVPCLIDKTLGLYGLPEDDLFAIGLPGEDRQLAGEERCEKFEKECRRKTEKIVADHFPHLIPQAEEMIYCMHEKRLADGYEIERREKSMGITGVNLFKFAPFIAKIALEEIDTVR